MMVSWFLLSFNFVLMDKSIVSTFYANNILVYQYREKRAMPFQKKHKLGFTSEQPFDKDPVCFKVSPGIKDKLKAVP
ncbi:hypothetical protein OGM63_09740, partial [Plectonema radiosum NIES-515]